MIGITGNAVENVSVSVSTRGRVDKRQLACLLFPDPNLLSPLDPNFSIHTYRPLPRSICADYKYIMSM